jgi:transposase InsO family protein
VLDTYLFDSPPDVREIVGGWIERCNHIRPRGALGGLPPARYRDPLVASEQSTFAALV